MFLFRKHWGTSELEGGRGIHTKARKTKRGVETAKIILDSLQLAPGFSIVGYK